MDPVPEMAEVKATVVNVTVVPAEEMLTLGAVTSPLESTATVPPPPVDADHLTPLPTAG